MNPNLAVAFLPAEPRSVEETGLNASLLTNLTLKYMYIRGLLSAQEIADALRLPFTNVIDHALDFLRRERLIEIRGSAGFGETSYQYTISDAGRIRARELMVDNGYVGPAPVPLEAYAEGVLQQSASRNPIAEESIRAATEHLVLGESLLAQLGPAVNSGKSMFLHGPSGNGKTALAEAIGEMLAGEILIPHAIAADGHVIKLYDAQNHKAVGGDGANATLPGLARGERFDRRWVLVRRPTIVAGGELTLEALDLTLDGGANYYEAPYQMKANGGMFLIDDFGRQQVRPRDLLNRWILPLEKRVDFMTLASGRKVQVPFDALIVFSTNMDPAELVDEAFLRRIRYKIELRDPTWEEYREILARVAQENEIPYSEGALQHLISEYYIKPKRNPRAVHPRDLVEELVDIARYRNLTPALTPELLDEACRSYFLRT